MILPGATLGLLGGGQLGRMFTMAARTLDYRVLVLDPDPLSPAADIANEHLCADYLDPTALERMASSCAAVTTEFENPPAEALTWLAQRCHVRPDSASVAIAQDRGREKSFLAQSGFPVGAFAIIDSEDDLRAACARIPMPALLKTSRFGYDGKGQARVEDFAQARATFERWGKRQCVLEEFLALEREVSVVLARGADGETVCFPVAENQHQAGILDVTIAPARVREHLAQKAKQIAISVAEQLNYCGTMAVEFFIVDGEKLLINELAPRPHNSGHYTIDACHTSQFEQQVRTLCGLPLGDASLIAPAVMVNILGDVWGTSEPRWEEVLRHRNVKLHLYGKREPRPGRKMGHYTVLAQSVETAIDLALAIKRALGPRGG